MYNFIKLSHNYRYFLANVIITVQYLYGRGLSMKFSMSYSVFPPWDHGIIYKWRDWSIIDIHVVEHNGTLYRADVCVLQIPMAGRAV